MNWLQRYANDRTSTRQALAAMSPNELHDVYKRYARKLTPSKQRALTPDMVIECLHRTLTRGHSFL